MNRPCFRTAMVSRAGGRKHNEDACGHRDGCWVIADGLGGHGGGEVASRIAVDCMLEALAGAATLSGAVLTQAIADANRAIQERQQTEPRLQQMRTTIVVLCSDGYQALWAHVGDSRFYHFRDGRLLFQTADHSVPQVLADTGKISRAAIRHHEDRNRLLRSLGNTKDLKPAVTETPVLVQAGDAFLLCTDGFWEYVTETEMEVVLAKAGEPQSWLNAMTALLLERAEPRHDNYSAIAVFVDIAVHQSMVIEDPAIE